MKLLSALCLLLVLVPTARSGAATDTLAEVSSLIESVTISGMDTKFLDTAKGMGQLARMMGPAGMAISLALTLMGAEEAESDELVAIKELHQKSDALLLEVKGFRSQFEAVVWNQLFLEDMNDWEAVLETINERVERYMDNPSHFQLTLLQAECQGFSAYELVNKIKVKLDGTQELENFYTALHHDYRAIDASMKYLEGLIVAAGFARPACLVTSPNIRDHPEVNATAELVHEGTHWLNEIDETASALSRVRKDYLVQVIERDNIIEKDIEQFMADNSAMSNDPYATNLVAFLKGKFSFNAEVRFTALVAGKDAASISTRIAESWWVGEQATAGSYGTYRQGSVRLEKYNKAVTVLWTYCKQPVIEDFVLVVSSFESADQELVNIFPNTYAHMYYRKRSGYGFASNGWKYRTKAEVSMTSGYYERITSWGKYEFSSTAGPDDYLFVMLTECSKSFQQTCTGSCEGADISYFTNWNLWG